MVGSLPSTLDVRSMAISSELIYLGCKGGYVEVWCKRKNNKIETLQIGSNSKIVCMALDADEEVLVVGTSDGKIQVNICFFSPFSLVLKVVHNWKSLFQDSDSF